MKNKWGFGEGGWLQFRKNIIRKNVHYGSYPLENGINDLKRISKIFTVNFRLLPTPSKIIDITSELFPILVRL